MRPVSSGACLKRVQLWAVGGARGGEEGSACREGNVSSAVKSTKRAMSERTTGTQPAGRAATGFAVAPATGHLWQQHELSEPPGQAGAVRRDAARVPSGCEAAARLLAVEDCS